MSRPSIAAGVLTHAAAALALAACLSLPLTTPSEATVGQGDPPPALDLPCRAGPEAVGCITARLDEIVATEGATAAVDAVVDLAAVDDRVAAECHQLLHHLGSIAASRAVSVGEALRVEATECWSGYYHGVVETTLGSLDDQDLRDAVPTFCEGIGEQRYGFERYNCVHGLGHGVAIVHGPDLGKALDVCAAFSDSWELSSCAGGVFMEHVVTIQRSGELPTGALGEPCTSVREAFKGACYAIQSSLVLWRLDNDFERTLEFCASVELHHVDGCNQSIGRDVSAFFADAPRDIVHTCGLGSPTAFGSCIRGAVINLVYEDHGAVRADRLCAAMVATPRANCAEARDGALAMLATS